MPPTNPLTIIFMDAGQGDSTLIVYPDGSLTLVDCGSIKNGQIAGPQIVEVLNRFLPLNNNTLNNFIITHPDQDHYNLVNSVLLSRNLTYKNIYYGGQLSEYENKKDKDATYNFLCKAQQANIAKTPPNNFNTTTKDANLSLGGVEVFVLAANATGKTGNGSDTNANSIVLLVRYKDVRYFLMGDATTQTEDLILAQVKATKSDVLKNTYWTGLKMGHHGSNTSSGSDWIKAIAPNALFVSADTRSFGSNGTGMPSKTFLAQVMGNANVQSFAPDHRYIYFDDQASSPTLKTFQPSDQTKLNLCTTLYAIQYTSSTEYVSTGGSWYSWVDDKATVWLNFTSQS